MLSLLIKSQDSLKLAVSLTALAISPLFPIMSEPEDRQADPALITFVGCQFIQLICLASKLFIIIDEEESQRERREVALK